MALLPQVRDETQRIAAALADHFACYAQQDQISVAVGDEPPIARLHVRPRNIPASAEDPFLGVEVHVVAHPEAPPAQLQALHGALEAADVHVWDGPVEVDPDGPPRRRR